MVASIRSAVTQSPDYPFKLIDAPIKLDQNEAPEDFPAELKAEVLRRLAEAPWHRYPDLHAETLCQAIGEHEAWPVAGVVTTTGSNVLISLLSQIAGIGKAVVTVKPTFALYALDANLLGGNTVEIPLRDDLTVDIAAVISAIRETPDADRGVVYLAQPQAPAGSALSSSDLMSLAEASSGWLLVLDEAYCQFSESDCKFIAEKHRHVVLLRTFSKSWGLAGLRLGYALTSEEVARQLKKMAPPFAVSVMQTVALQVALENPQYVNARIRTIIDERKRVHDILLNHPTWKVYRSHANFLLIRTPDAGKAFDQLLSHGVLVRRQDSYYGLGGCIRVTIGTRAENDAFLAAVAAPV
jgi:histidinol-phosphate aminotransferase